MKKHYKRKSYIYKIKLSAKKKREINWIAHKEGITSNRVIKNAIQEYLSQYDLSELYNNPILRNQLELFNIEEATKENYQLDLKI